MAIERGIFVKGLLAWYEDHKRALPWRENRTAYRVWIAEVILQQTRVVQGRPYYERFIERYPSVEALAAASEEDILLLWKGLGYYRRAMNLLRAAQQVVKERGGAFPKDYKGLLELPGVGEYTAAAIASIAYGECVALLDGNVHRVLTRVFGIEGDIAQLATRKLLKKRAHYLLPATNPGRYNEALMEFGALHCTPAKPQCATCPFKRRCIAYKEDKVGLLPVKGKRKPLRERFFHYFMFTWKGKLFWRKRDYSDIWGGLHDFYLVEKEGLVAWPALGDDLLGALHEKGSSIGRVGGEYKHVLTHQRLRVRFFKVVLTKEALALLKGKITTLQGQWHENGDKVATPILIKRFCDEHAAKLAAQ